MKIPISTIWLVISLVLLTFMACANLPSPQKGFDYFTLIVLPDTQNYSQNYPDIFESQTNWIKTHTPDMNILFTIHLGDIVNNYNRSTEWINAKRAMNVLSGLPYSVIPGNHDNNNGKDNTNFNYYFNYSAISQYPWYSGHYPASGNENSYEEFTFAGIKYMILNIGYGEVEKSLDWANGVVSKNEDTNIIVGAHSYLDEKGNHLNPGDKLWDKLIRKYPNIFLVLSGHIHAEKRNTRLGDEGNTEVDPIVRTA